MSSKTKIIVLRMKEIIYTAIFVGFAILLIILLLYMLRPGKDESAGGSESAVAKDLNSGGEQPGQHAAKREPHAAEDGTESSGAQTASYTPGLYSSSITLGSQIANVEVTVDATRITSVALVPLSDSVAAMYPLMQPAMDSLAPQIIENQTLEGIEYPAGSQYTSMALMKAIEAALEKAK